MANVVAHQAQQAPGAVPARRSLVAVLAAVVFILALAVDLRVLPADGALGADFNDFYVAAMAQSRGLNPYDGAVVTRLEVQTFGHAGFSNTVASPPAFFVAFRPFTWLPPREGYLLWLAISVVVWLLAVRACSAALGVGRTRLVWMLALGPATAIAMFLGQISLLLTACYLWAICAARSRRHALAGLLLALTLVKPHLMIVPAALLCGLSWQRGGRRMATFAVSGAAAVCALAVPFSEPDALRHWAQALVDYGSRFDRWQPDISSLAGCYIPFVPRGVERLLSALCLACGLAYAALLVRRGMQERVAAGDGRWWRLLALGISSWLLVLPYIHPYDDMLLLVPLLVLLARDRGSMPQGPALLAIGGMLSLPELDLMGFRPNLTFSYTVLPAIAALCALLSMRDRTVPAEPDPGYAEPGPVELSPAPGP